MKKLLENKEQLWCEYSDLPSPMAYEVCADYDSMGNHGRFPKTIKRRNKLSKLLKILKKKYIYNKI